MNSEIINADQANKCDFKNESYQIKDIKSKMKLNSIWILLLWIKKPSIKMLTGKSSNNK